LTAVNYLAGYTIPKRRLIPGWSLIAGTIVMALLSAGSASGFNITDTSVVVRWTATGDDGYLGRASYYNLRYMAVSSDSVGMDSTNWLSAYTIPLGRPSASGLLDSAEILGLQPSTVYDILILIGDEVPNWSEISNVLRVTTLPRLVVSTPDSEEDSRPVDFQLSQNYPNPFNPTTTISFEIGRSHQVRIEIFNIRGQVVKLLNDQQMSAGRHKVSWDGRDYAGNSAASGMYFYRVRAGEFVQTNKMVLLR